MAPLATPPVSEGIPSVSGEMEGEIRTETTPQLRKAVYVHVSDLAQPYNIDPEKLKAEMAKVHNEKMSTEDGIVGKAEQSANLREKENEHKDLNQDDGGISMDKLEIKSLEGSPRVTKKGQYNQKLHPPSGGFNLCLLVGKVNVVVDKLRVDRSRVRVAEVEVGDETGTMSLRARDEQIDMLKEISGRKGAAVLRNCTLELYQGRHLRLAVTKWGKLRAYPDNIASTPTPPKELNQDLNYSCVDLNLVVGDTKSAQASPASSTSDKQRGKIDDASSIRTSSSNHSRQHQMWRGGEGLDVKRDQSFYRQGQMAGQLYGMQYHEGGVGEQANQVLFSPVQSFAPLYSDGNMNMPQYSYLVPLPKRNDEGGQNYYQRHINEDSQRREHQYKQQQHQLLLQQYEMQQRQMQQMQLFQQQQERQRQLFDPHRQQQPPQLQSPFIDPEILQSTSVDSGGDFYPVAPGAEHHPTALPPMISPGQVLIPQQTGTMPVVGASQQSSDEHAHLQQLFPLDSPPMATANEPSKRSGHHHRGGGISMRHERTRQKQPVDTTSSIRTGGSGAPKHRSSGGNTRGAIRGNAPVHGTPKQPNADRRKVPTFPGGRYPTHPLTEESQFVSARPHERQTLPANLQPSLDVDTSPALGHNPNAASFDPSYTESQGVMHTPQPAQPTQFAYVPYSPQQTAGAMYGSPGFCMYVAPIPISQGHNFREPTASRARSRGSPDPPGAAGADASEDDVPKRT